MEGGVCALIMLVKSCKFEGVQEKVCLFLPLIAFVYNLQASFIV